MFLTSLRLLENRKQLHHCTSAIKNRTSIPLNITSKHDHNHKRPPRTVSQPMNISLRNTSLSTEFEPTAVPG